MSDKKLDPKIKADWLAWLRDPNNKQDTGRLKTDKGHCCLGGLTEVCIDNGLEDLWEPSVEVEGYEYDGSFSTLPANVDKFTGEALGAFGSLSHYYPTSDGKADSLASLNDSGYTFLEIADIIDEEF